MTAQTTAPRPTTAEAPLRPLLDQLARGRDLTAVRDLVEAGAESGGGGVAATGLFPSRTSPAAPPPSSRS